MPKLSVIILSYNTAEITKECIETLMWSLKNIEAEVIVIDNASDDGSTEEIKNLKFKIKNLKFIENKFNVGYPKGNNQGLKEAKGEYVLFLNSDVIVQKINFKQLLQYLDNKPDVGVMTVKVTLPDGQIDPASHRGFPTLWNSFCYFFKLEALLGKIPVLNKIFGGYHLTCLDLRTVHEIDSPSGAFYLTRKSILEKVKGFDESFFMYGEDLDLSYRIKEKGYKVLYYPLDHVVHLKYASGLKNIDQVHCDKIKNYFYQAMEIFYKKHYLQKYPTAINNLVYLFIKLKKSLS